MICQEFDEDGAVSSKVVVVFQSCVWLRKGCPVLRCVIAECVNAVGSAGSSGVGVEGYGQAWQKAPSPVSRCLPRERELREGVRGEVARCAVCTACTPCGRPGWARPRAVG